MHVIPTFFSLPSAERCEIIHWYERTALYLSGKISHWSTAALYYHCNGFIAIGMMMIELFQWSDSYSGVSGCYSASYLVCSGQYFSHQGKVLSDIWEIMWWAPESTIQSDSRDRILLGNPATCCRPCPHVPSAPLSSIGTVCISQVIGILWLHQHL